MHNHAYRRHHCREITGPSADELADGLEPNFIVGGFFPDIPVERQPWVFGDKWGRNPGLVGLRQDAAPDLASGVGAVDHHVDEDDEYFTHPGTLFDLGGRGVGYNSNLYRSQSPGGFSPRVGYRAGVQMDSYGTPVGAIHFSGPSFQHRLTTPEEHERRQDQRGARRAHAIFAAQDRFKRWAERNLIPIKAAFHDEEGIAAGWLVTLSSRNDVAEAHTAARRISTLYKTHYKIQSREEGWDVGKNDHVVFFADDPYAVVVVPGELSQLGEPTIAVDQDEAGSFLSGLFNKNPEKRAERIKRKIERLENRIAKLKEKLGGDEAGLVSVGRLAAAGFPFDGGRVGAADSASSRRWAKVKSWRQAMDGSSGRGGLAKMHMKQQAKSAQAAFGRGSGHGGSGGGSGRGQAARGHMKHSALQAQQSWSGRGGSRGSRVPVGYAAPPSSSTHYFGGGRYGGYSGPSVPTSPELASVPTLSASALQAAATAMPAAMVQGHIDMFDAAGRVQRRQRRRSTRRSARRGTRRGGSTRARTAQSSGRSASGPTSSSSSGRGGRSVLVTKKKSTMASQSSSSSGKSTAERRQAMQDARGANLQKIAAARQQQQQYGGGGGGSFGGGGSPQGGGGSGSQEGGGGGGEGYPSPYDYPPEFDYPEEASEESPEIIEEEFEEPVEESAPAADYPTFEEAEAPAIGPAVSYDPYAPIGDEQPAYDPYAPITDGFSFISVGRLW